MTTSIEEALYQGRMQFFSAGIPGFEADLLLQSILKLNRIDLFTQAKRLLSDKEYSNFHSWIQRRMSHEPLSYITQERFFYRQQFTVLPGTFIPRPETEILVEECLRFLQTLSSRDLIGLDLCTGSGVIALSLVSALPSLSMDAVETSFSALKSAQTNLEALRAQTKVNLYQGDLYSALPEHKLYDVIVSNPPYIPSHRIAQLSPEVRSEPIIALDGGKDGLDIILRIIHDGTMWLKSKGLLLFEIDGKEQVEPIFASLQKAGYVELICKNDLAGFPRVMGGYLQ
ncbi:MAG TPA: peptide chain release factor N(5)-glutamine methyltransferase [Caldisericia bacterium]|nr:peptide chain release factor N(5)-glutamine methyltransferase [Caldisericia bacterium]